MATTPTVKVIQNGSRVLVLEVEYVYVDAEVAAAVVVDVSAYSCTRVAIRCVKSSLAGHVGRLEWDATANTLALALPDGDFEFCATRNGPILNNAGTGITGDLVLTTLGLAAGEAGTIRLELVKKA